MQYFHFLIVRIAHAGSLTGKLLSWLVVKVIPMWQGEMEIELSYPSIDWIRDVPLYLMGQGSIRPQLMTQFMEDIFCANFTNQFLSKGCTSILILQWFVYHHCIKYSQNKCRYDVNGFVVELPALTAYRYGHTCAELPSTGVRSDFEFTLTPAGLHRCWGNCFGILQYFCIDPSSPLHVLMDCHCFSSAGTV